MIWSKYLNNFNLYIWSKTSKCVKNWILFATWLLRRIQSLSLRASKVTPRHIPPQCLHHEELFVDAAARHSSTWRTAQCKNATHLTGPTPVACHTQARLLQWWCAKQKRGPNCWVLPGDAAQPSLLSSSLQPQHRSVSPRTSARSPSSGQRRAEPGDAGS